MRSKVPHLARFSRSKIQVFDWFQQCQHPFSIFHQQMMVFFVCLSEKMSHPQRSRLFTVAEVRELVVDSNSGTEHFFFMYKS